MDLIGEAAGGGELSQAQAQAIVAQAVEQFRPDGKTVLAIIPDHTRTCPLPAMTRMLHAALAGRAKRLDFLVALGTHPPMSDAQIDRLLGVPPGKRGEVFPGVTVHNHRWKDGGALRKVGTLTRRQVEEISGGKFAMDVDVTVNKLVFEYDVVVILGPVFPHEVAGFSGGNKYFFPGICGQELLDFFHWLGAVVTNPRIIGAKRTPVRDTIDAAADLLTMEKFAFCMVVKGEALAGLYFGRPKEAWSAAADLSARLHVVYVDKPYASILSRAPKMYDDIWTAGKCMYKMEPVVADGGELIIYAPHVTEVSYTHGTIIDEIGYHTRDYFLAQWDRFKHYPWGVLAHSTHVRGIGSYAGGVERPRIQVTLATGIPESRCRKINLGYRDPASIDVSQWEGRQAEGRLYVPQAGEMLYKLKHLPAWQRLDWARAQQRVAGACLPQAGLARAASPRSPDRIVRRVGSAVCCPRDAAGFARNTYHGSTYSVPGSSTWPHQSGSYRPLATYPRKLDQGHSIGRAARPCFTGLAWMYSTCRTQSRRSRIVCSQKRFSQMPR